MDRRYDGHAWTRTITSNIKNELKLIFWTSSCLGHLHCDNVDCEYLTSVHRTPEVNETMWDGLLEKLFEVGSTTITDCTVVCKSCNTLPTCVALCPAKYTTWLQLHTWQEPAFTWELTRTRWNLDSTMTSSNRQWTWSVSKWSKPHQQLDPLSS